MERFIKEDIVVVPFPFSNLTLSKRRPALVLADLEGDDIILCQITSKYKKDRYSVFISQKDLKEGVLKVESYVRPNKIFTADKSIILYKLGSLKEESFMQVMKKLQEILGIK